jgi:phospholipid transport system substrate-binding protein
MMAMGAAALFAGVSLAPTPASANGSATVQTLYDTLLNAMRNGPSLGARGRYAQIAPVVRRVFDIQLMTRVAVGPEWNNLSEQQRQQVAQAFENYIAAIYAERFDSYGGERLQVVGEQPNAQGVIVTSHIIKSNGEPVQVNYLMHQNGSGWQIADVYLNGSISELATRRSEFSSILRSQGINGLIGTLNAKAASLTVQRAG